MMWVRTSSLGWIRAASCPSSTSDVWSSCTYCGHVGLSVGFGAVRSAGYTSWTSTSTPAAARTRFSLGFVSPEITTLRPGASKRYPYASRHVPCSTSIAVAGPEASGSGRGLPVPSSTTTVLSCPAAEPCNPRTDCCATLQTVLNRRIARRLTFPASPFPLLPSAHASHQVADRLDQEEQH